MRSRVSGRFMPISRKAWRSSWLIWEREARSPVLSRVRDRNRMAETFGVEAERGSVRMRQSRSMRGSHCLISLDPWEPCGLTLREVEFAHACTCFLPVISKESACKPLSTKESRPVFSLFYRGSPLGGLNVFLYT